MCETRLYGNLAIRIKELSGIIFAKAGLERMELLPANHIVLDWMLPAPAQGIVGIVCRTDDEEIREICRSISDEQSFMEGFC